MKAQIVERIDVFRVLILLNEGGIFNDLDRVYNRPMHEVMPRPGKTAMIMPTEFDTHLAWDHIGTSPGNML